MGLTTRIPNSTRVASLDKQLKGKVDNMVVKSAKSYLKVTSDNIKYLDVLKDLNMIPKFKKSNGLIYLKKAIYALVLINL